MTKTNIVSSRVALLLLVFVLAFTAIIPHNAYALELANRDAVWASVHTYADAGNQRTKIGMTSIYGAYYMILPSTASPDAVTLYVNLPMLSSVKARAAGGEVNITNGTTLNLNALCPDGKYKLSFEVKDRGNILNYELNFLFSKNISSMYLVSDDVSLKGRSWVEGSLSKSNKATGSMVMKNADGTTVYDGALTQIKGRGNSTWGLPKKPYQIKLDAKADLLCTGDDKNKTKTWILLANYLDCSSLRNTLALNAGKALGMDMNIESCYTDLYYDGEYRGTYMLTEKVEVGKGRVAITDLEELNEAANPGVDIEGFPTEFATTANGATYKYCAGMQSPADVTGGYLLEMDYEERAIEEVCYFRTSRGQHVVVKSPEFASKEEMNYIATFYQEYEDAIYNDGTNPVTGKYYSDYVDPDSVARYYLINEFSQARDCFLSSAYLHLDAGQNKMIMGPLWDYDMSFGKGGEDGVEFEEPIGMHVIYAPTCEALLKIDDFYNRVKNIYINQLYPLVKNVILGDKNAVSGDGALHSLTYYENLVSESSKFNVMMWYPGTDLRYENTRLRDFITHRAENLKRIFGGSNGSEEEEIWFFDVLSYSWYYEEVRNACRQKLMYGIGNGLFGPDNYVDRAQAAQIIVNMTGMSDEAIENKFSDISADDWYAQAVLWTTNEGIMDGFADGTFRPREKITKENLLVYLYRYMKKPAIGTDYLSGYSDAYLLSEEGRVAMEWGIANGIVQGYNGALGASNNIPRSEIAAILMRFYNNVLSTN